MDEFAVKKGWSFYSILLMLIITNLLLFILLRFSDSYTITVLLRLALVVINIYQLYYLLLSITLKYIIDDNNIYITAIFGYKKVVIPFNSIEGYKVLEGRIRGVKLSGVGKEKFAFGKSVIDKIGIAHMFVTSLEKIVYIKTDAITYAISPEKVEALEKILKEKGIGSIQPKDGYKKSYKIYKDKSFTIPFFIVSIIIVIFTLNPFILYLRKMLPEKMPLSFNGRFIPIDYGTGKQFAFNQMIYGVLNMAVLFFMYYASYFHAKYDKKSAYRYIYISLLIALMFLFMQFKILNTYK